MHEMSLAMGVLQIIEDAARTEGFSRVRAVRLEIGRLAHVEVEALRFCFDVVVKGSVAEGAALEVLPTPGAALCLACGESVPMTLSCDPCPRCGGLRLQITGGTEMRLKDLEVD